MNTATVFRSALVSTLALSVACTNRTSDFVDYRPSMTQLRIGEVLVEDPPVIPEDNYIPGIVVAPEQFSYDDESGLRLAPGATAALTDFSKMTDIPDPAMLDKHVDTYEYSRLPGAMIDEWDEMAVTYEDVNQGAIANCYMVAALTGVVYADPTGDLTNGMIREINDAEGNLQHYAVRFYDAWGDPQDVEIDADLVRRSGKPLYARSADSRSDGEELWVGLVEKAYAQWHDSYEKIGNGGYTGDVLQALTGANANYKRLEYQSDESLFRAVVDAVNEGRPVASGTFGEDSGVDYEGTGVYAWHAYTVLGADQVDGTYRVQLRNPWGSSEPADNGPDDGIFWLDFRDWRKLYSNVTIGGSYEPDTTAPAAVSDLHTLEVVDGRAVMGFTSTGDDSTSGLAYAYDVRVSTRPIDETNFYDAPRVVVADPQSPNTVEQMQIEMPVGTTAFVAVRVLDESGNVSPLSNVVQIDLGTRPDDTPTFSGELWFQFETDDGAWAPTGLWHRSTAASTSGQYSWYMGVDQQLNYDTGSQVQATLTSQVFDLSGTSTVEMLWEQILDVEEGAEYDAAWVEVSTDGFATSTRVWEKTTTYDTWRLEYVDLSQFAGQAIQVRFSFDSADEVNNEGLGWFVDDVFIDAY